MASWELVEEYQSLQIYFRHRFNLGDAVKIYPKLDDALNQESGSEGRKLLVHLPPQPITPEFCQNLYDQFKSLENFHILLLADEKDLERYFKRRPVRGVRVKMISWSWTERKKPN